MKMKLFAVVVVFVIPLVAMVLNAQTPSPFLFLGLTSSLSGCQWPSGVAVGTAFCPVLQSGGSISLALAANGGAFAFVGAGAQGPPGIQGPIGLTGATGQQGPPGQNGTGITVGSKITCAPDKGQTVSSGFVCTVTNIQ